MLSKLKDAFPGLTTQGRIKTQPRYYYGDCGITICLNVDLIPILWVLSTSDGILYEKNQTFDLKRAKPFEPHEVITYRTRSNSYEKISVELCRQIHHIVLRLKEAKIKNRREGSRWSWFFSDYDFCNKIIKDLENTHSNLILEVSAVRDNQPHKTLVVKQNCLKKFKYKLILKPFYLDSKRISVFKQLVDSYQEDIKLSPYFETMMGYLTNNDVISSRRLGSSHIYTQSLEVLTVLEMMHSGLIKKIYELVTSESLDSKT